jgi:CelD/BcsL family acetyltransferase involved in cellulose biosynthesis
MLLPSWQVRVGRSLQHSLNLSWAGATRPCSTPFIGAAPLGTVKIRPVTRPQDDEPRVATGATGPAPARYRAVDMSALGAAERLRWHELRASNPALDSPYFHPEFAGAVAATRPGVKVVIGEDAAGVIESFLPVQVDGRACRPAGHPAADFQGPVCAPAASFDLVRAVQATGASRYEFDHLREGIPAVGPWLSGSQPSPYMEVAGGLDGYLSRAAKSGKDKASEARRLTNKAEREYGPVRIEADVADASLLDTVIELKRRQYGSTGARDFFADARHVALMHRLLDTRTDDFAGMLSAVYAGPQLVAAHFGIRAGAVLHWWFPVYAPDLSRYSPGWILLRAVIAAAPDLGLERIDLGRGMDDYKRRAMTGQQTVLQGAVIPNPVLHHLARARTRAIGAMKASPLAPRLRQAVRASRRRAS